MTSEDSREPASAGSSAPVQVAGEGRCAGRAELALSLAGRALDPNAPSGPDLVLARMLLREAVVWVARAFAGDVPGDFHTSLAGLASSGVLARATGDAAKATTELLALEESASPVASLAEAERLVMKLVDAAQGRRATLLHERARRWGFGVLLLLSIGLVFSYSWTRPWRSYTFRTSSTYAGFSGTGKLGDASVRDLLFHTKQEAGPSVVVDLLTSRTIHEVVLKNRFDCCQERGVPLVVELSGDAKEWRTIAQRDEKFDTWEARFDPQSAHYVRIRSLGRTVLHMREIQVR